MIDMSTGQIGYAGLSFGAFLGMGGRVVRRPVARHEVRHDGASFSS
jgi:hypothetical protein